MSVPVRHKESVASSVPAACIPNAPASLDENATPVRGAVREHDVNLGTLPDKPLEKSRRDVGVGARAPEGIGEDLSEPRRHLREARYDLVCDVLARRGCLEEAVRNLDHAFVALGAVFPVLLALKPCDSSVRDPACCREFRRRRAKRLEPCHTVARQCSDVETRAADSPTQCDERDIGNRVNVRDFWVLSARHRRRMASNLRMFRSARNGTIERPRRSSASMAISKGTPSTSCWRDSEGACSHGDLGGVVIEESEPLAGFVSQECKLLPYLWYSTQLRRV